jgi:membrane protein YqaA with SNARE-associated domain
MIESVIHWLLNVLAVPNVGLSAAFIVSFVAATLLPLGSEPAVFAVIKANTTLFWPALLVATAGNTLGGALDYWMGYAAHQAFARERSTRWFGWLRRYGAKTMLLAWLPGIGDPICTLGGWLNLPFWPCFFYMTVGKFLRYATVTWLLLEVPDGFWRQVAQWLS